MIIHIQNAVIVTLDAHRHVLHGADLLIRDDRILDFGDPMELKERHPDITPDKMIDANGNILMPGFVNLHAHSVAAGLRGREDALMFVKNRQRDPYQEYYHALTPEEAYHFSMLAAFEMIRTGTTTVLDCSSHSESVADAFGGAGLRTYLCTGRIYDSALCGSPAGGTRTMARAVEFSENQLRKDNLVTPVLHPYAADACSVGLLREIQAEAKRLGLMITAHAGEYPEELEITRTVLGKSAVAHYEEAGLLTRDFIAAGCAFLSEGDLHALSQGRSHAAFTPAFSAKIAHTAPINAAISMGVGVGLGTGGLSYDMVKVLRHGITSWRLREHSPTEPHPDTIVELATMGGAKALGLRDEIGCIEVGRKADLVILDCWRTDIRPVYGDKYMSNLSHTGMGQDVITTIVNGNILMENREMLAMDAAQVLRRARRSAGDLFARMGI